MSQQDAQVNVEPTPARMTLDEFFERLRQTPRDWRVTERGGIRRGNGDFMDEQQCPISSLADRPVIDWGIAFRELQLDGDLSMRILDSADCDGHNEGYRWFDPALRAKLLDRCGLRDAGAGSR